MNIILGVTIFPTRYSIPSTLQSKHFALPYLDSQSQSLGDSFKKQFEVPFGLDRIGLVWFGVQGLPALLPLTKLLPLPTNHLQTRALALLCALFLLVSLNDFVRSMEQ